MATVNVEKEHIEKAISEMRRYANAYQNYLEAGSFQQLETFLEFAAELDVINAAITAFEAAL